jgi:hypothetical protein
LKAVPIDLENYAKAALFLCGKWRKIDAKEDIITEIKDRKLHSTQK